MGPSAGSLRKKLELSEKLAETIDVIHRASSLEEIILGIRERILELVEARRLTVYAVDPRTQTIFSLYKDGTKVKRIRVPRNYSSIVGFCGMTGTTVSVRDAYDGEELKGIHPRLAFDDRWDRRSGFRTKEVVTAPILYERQLLGVLQVLNSGDEKPFTPEEVAALEKTASTLGAAFYNLRRRSTEKQPHRFGDLVDRGLIAENVLMKAVAAAREEKVPVPTVLLKKHDISKEDLLRSLALFHGVESFIFDGTQRMPQAMRGRLNINFLKKNLVAPLERKGNTVRFILEDPSDLDKREAIRILRLSPRHEFLVALREDIVAYIDYSYDVEPEKAGPAEAGVEEILGELSLTEKAPEADDSLELDESDSAIVRLASRIILDAHARGASDIHVEPYGRARPTRIRLRIDGACTVYKEIPASHRRALVSRFKIMSNLDISERRKPQDGKIKFRTGKGLLELRVATLPSAGGEEDVVMRLLAASRPMKLEQMGFSDRNITVFQEMVAKPYGIILCVGPTGSGKTTTLHSALSHINTPEKKIWTAEDPVEITQFGLRQVPVRSKIDVTFSTLLRSFLRADPDVIMIGEMRDEETAQVGVEASLTGHLVLSTLHTNSAPETVTRLLDLGVDPYSFADALLCVLAQRLARRLCIKCKKPYNPSKEEFQAIVEEYDAGDFEKLGIDYGDDLEFFAPVGCPVCNGSGYKGRLGIHELLAGSDEVKRVIQKRAPVEQIRRQAIADGMTTLMQDGIRKVFQGITDMKQIRAVCIR